MGDTHYTSVIGGYAPVVLHSILATATGDGKIAWTVPQALTIREVGLHLFGTTPTATTDTLSIQLRVGTTDKLSAVLTLHASNSSLNTISTETISSFFATGKNRCFTQIINTGF